jgi:molybdate transport system ATP-binding protein
LRCLAGLERPESGRIAFASEPWFDAEKKVFLSPQRRGIGYLFQDYALFPHLSVATNIAYGLMQHPVADRQRRVAEMLELFGLLGLENRWPRQLSGGEQQRVALARVLAGRPRLLLLDEPLSALDDPTRERLRQELPRLLSCFDVPVVLVTHDRDEAAALADRLIVLSQGRVLQQGTAADVFTHPASLAVARIAGIENVLPGRATNSADDGATVQVGPILLRTCAITAAGAVHVCIPADAVHLSAGLGEHANRLPSRVTSVTPEGTLVRIRLDCGFPLTARLRRRESLALGLRAGTEVNAYVDPADIHLIVADNRSERSTSDRKERQPCER